MTRPTLSLYDRAGRRCLPVVSWWFDAGIPGHVVLFSSMYCRICSSVIRYSWPTLTAARRLDLIISRIVFTCTLSRSATSSVV